MTPPAQPRKLLTPEQLARARELWLAGGSRDEVARGIGVTIDTLRARMADQLADLPRRGRGGNRRAPTPDPTPAEIRLACAELRRQWPIERYLPPALDAEKLGRAAG
jgi:hypothetical protein